MRKTVFQACSADAVALFERAPFVHLAGVGEDGQPILRTLHGLVVGDSLVFHGATVGEKLELVGRAVVVTAEEVVARIPSYAIDPERACPATTYYRAAEVRGVLERVDDPAEEAALMAAFMRRFQPEGGYASIPPGGVSLLRVDLRGAVGKHKLGQNRGPAQLSKVVAFLWRRGDPGDVEAIEALLPFVPTPAFLEAPPGITLGIAPTETDAHVVAQLLDETYWNRGVPRARRARAQRGSTAWIVARSPGGIVGSVRVVSDGARWAYIADVIVRAEHRGRGIATAMLRAALDHPRVRDVERVTLRTIDAMPLYEALGFEREPERPEVCRMQRVQSSNRCPNRAIGARP